MVNYADAQRASSTYQRELASLSMLSQDYGQLVESKAARAAWLQEANATPGLESLAGVWAFKQEEAIDTGRPTLRKAVVMPGVAWNPPQTCQEVDGLSWGAAGEFTSVKKPGKDGYIIAFFR